MPLPSSFDPVSAAQGAAAWHAFWWAIVTLTELLAARAKADGREDWQDLFWPKMLARLDAARHERQASRR